MKKTWLFILFLLVGVFFFVGCSEKEGKFVVSVTKSETGEIVIEYADGSKETISMPEAESEKGDKGDKGETGDKVLWH